jgi:hypothetical protein
MENNEHAVTTTRGIIDMVKIDELTGIMDRINRFQGIVQQNLHEGTDYGIIPNCGKKPTLLKPGAEKLLMLLGLRSEFDIVQQTRDFEKGFFAYQIKSKLFKGDILITEGMGSCNTKENKYIKSSGFSVDNTVLKMAKKRALVDAALMVGSLSGIFTQDVEDMDFKDLGGYDKKDYKKKTVPPSATQLNKDKIIDIGPVEQSGVITKVQAMQMFAMAMGNNDLVKEVMKKYCYDKSGDIREMDYKKICQEIKDKIDEDMPPQFNE